MSDLRKYINKRKQMDQDFAKDYESGYEEFKIGLLLKELRIKNGLTQEELATKIHTTKSAISRMENHTEDIKLSSLEKIALAFGKRIKIELL